MNKWQAAVEGSKEIYFAVIATSITLAVVFLPIIFLQGFVGQIVPRIWNCGSRRCTDFCICITYPYTCTECKADAKKCS